jgi:hypothetical protein
MVEYVTSFVGEVDPDATAVEFLLVEGLDCCFSLLRGGQGHKSKATGATGFTIAHDDRLREGISCTFMETEIVWRSCPDRGRERGNGIQREVLPEGRSDGEEEGRKKKRR